MRPGFSPSPLERGSWGWGVRESPHDGPPDRRLPLYGHRYTVEPTPSLPLDACLDFFPSGSGTTEQGDSLQAVALSFAA
jgi:hypothetical protein